MKKSEPWHRDLKAGARCAVAVPDPSGAPPRYAYAKLLDAPGDEDVAVRLYDEQNPAGREGTIPLLCIIVEISPEQFEAARRCNYPADPRAGMALANQTTTRIGKA